MRTTGDGFAKVFCGSGIWFEFAFFNVFVDLFAEHSVPWRDHERNVAVSTRLTCKAKIRALFIWLLVALKLYIVAFAPLDRIELFFAAEDTDPASTAGRSSAFDRDRTLPTALV